MRPRTWWSAAALSLLVTAALLTSTGPSADAVPVPGDLLPSGLPLPPLPSPTLPAPDVPTPTATRTTGPTTPPAPQQTATSPGTAAQPGPGAPVATGSAPAPGGAASLIANDPGASLYPQPPVQPPTTPAAALAVQLADVEQRIQYLHNVLAGTAEDLATAQQRLGAVPALIVLLTGPATTSPPRGIPADTPAGRVAALSAALASGQAELAQREAQALALQQRIAGQVSVAGTPGTTLQWPVRGTITSRYGNRLDPYYHVWQLHPGIDIAAAPGTPIFAAAAGRVTQAGWFGGYGNYTCIAHGQQGGQPVSTCYGHQVRILVAPGQQVAAGALIGLVGSTGASTGPHLHFEVRLNGRPVDPLPWLP